MRAIRFSRYGEPDVLELADVPAPHATAGQIRIAVRAAGVNALERKIRAGLLQHVRRLELPAGIGGDAAGIVDEVGDGVTDVEVGDAVLGSGVETYAEHAVLTSWARKPERASFEEAAGYPTPFETAFRALGELRARSGQTILVTGASGGVGAIVVQLALQRGITVIGTASQRNQDHVASLGAIPVTYGDGLADRVLAIARGGVDAVLDVAGAGNVQELITLTDRPEHVVSIADFDAPDHGARVSVGFGADRAPALRKGARLVAEGRLQLPVSQTFPLARAGDAQAASATGGTPGRIVITVP